jgi:hypothetical protein
MTIVEQDHGEWIRSVSGDCAGGVDTSAIQLFAHRFAVAIRADGPDVRRAQSHRRTRRERRRHLTAAGHQVFADPEFCKRAVGRGK